MRWASIWSLDVTELAASKTKNKQKSHISFIHYLLNSSYKLGTILRTKQRYKSDKNHFLTDPYSTGKGNEGESARKDFRKEWVEKIKMQETENVPDVFNGKIIL